MAGGFSVQGVEIEGFKGFTSRKSIDFKGRHVFLLGENGNGKSSIVEAVRWGLFGSASGRNEIVKNQHYSGDCRVTVKLTRDGEPWTLRRTLNLSTGNTSVPILTDQHGNRHLMREIMPQIDSVDAGEGTHIIFAPQSTPLRRQPEDLRPFERTVFNYLGLTHPRALLSNIEEFLEAQAEAENELYQFAEELIYSGSHSSRKRETTQRKYGTEMVLDEELTEARKSIDGQILEVRTSRGYILSAPPWGDGHPPSVAASEQKVRGFIGEVTGKPPDDDLVGLSLDALLESAEALLGERRTQDQSSLNRETAELARRRGRLENLRDIQSQVSTQKSNIKSTQAKLDTVLDGLTSDELQEKLEATKYKATTESIKRRIVQNAIVLIGRDESETVPCPICDSHHDRQILESALQNTVGHPDNELSSIVDGLESQLQKSEELQNSLNVQETVLDLLKQSATSTMSLVVDDDKRKLAETNDIDQLIKNYSEKESMVKAQIDDQETWFMSKRAQLDRLKEESRFHQIQRRLNQLQADRREFERVIESYNHLVAFGESVRAIRGVVNTRLSEQLAQDIPRVSDTLSKAFNALTQHPWYDRLKISEDNLPKLELRVASSQDPIGREDPTGVLNGQAESALNLVPYFAFSQPDDTPTEVYLVMLDDPTRALDTGHIIPFQSERAI